MANAKSFEEEAWDAAFAAESGAINREVSPNDPLEKLCRVGPRSRDLDLQMIEPIKVFDNLYHVGPCFVSSWLLTTPQGHILFDTAQEPYVGLIEANIKKLGINPRDIKYIVISQGLLDHFGGAKRLQEFTGARVVTTSADWKMIEYAAGKPNFRDEDKPTEVPKRDMVVGEGDRLDLGDQHLIIHTTPVHTSGNLFIEGIVLRDGAQTYHGIWGNSEGIAPGVAGAEQALKNAQKLMAMQNVQVLIQTHAWQSPSGYPGGGIHERAKKLVDRKPGEPHPFVDPATWNARVNGMLETANKKLAEEQAKASASQTK
jgi:metallo-beta-lactamase class B